MGENELSYCELRAKEVVNAADGKRMGRIVDMLFSRENGAICGIVVPLTRRGVFAKNQDVFIPWHCVQTIGEDVILVHLTVEPDGHVTCKHTPPPPKDCHGGHDHCEGHNAGHNAGCAPPPPPPDHPRCDNRCEKCMLFDCAYRWSQLH